MFEAIERASERMIRTVRSMLEMARLESATVDFMPVPLGLARLVEDRIKSFYPTARAKGLELVCDLLEPQATILFDPFCLERSLDLLIDNAIKFTTNGRVTVRLARENGGGLYLEVEDTGIGIDPDYLPRMFQTFSQQDVSKTRQFEGLGLGLAMVKRFLALGGARITVASQRASGSTFTIHFDRGLEVTPPAISPSPRIEAADRPTILLVEDDVASSLMVQKLLQKDYRLLVASNSEETRERLAAHGAEIEVVLMDISLGGGSEDGLALTRYIRETPALHHIRVIATTAHALPEDRERCMAAGCDAYLAKPFRRDELRDLIAQIFAADAAHAIAI